MLIKILLFGVCWLFATMFSFGIVGSDSNDFPIPQTLREIYRKHKFELILHQILFFVFFFISCLLTNN